MIINIAKDFSRTPSARYKNEGKYSGEEFRNNILLPKVKEALKNNEILSINLDGTSGYSTSFLEESFGGLVRNNEFNMDDLIKHIKFISIEDDSYIEEIKSYMYDAFFNKF